MGLFDPRYRTRYNCYASPLFATMPGLVKQTVPSTITNNGSISRDLVANISNGIRYKVNRFYNYGKTGSYFNGIPEGSYSYQLTGYYTVLRTLLEEIHNKKITLESALVIPSGSGSHLYKAEYYIVHVADPGSDDENTEEDFIFEYDTADGTYPTLDIPQVEAEGSYYPMIPLRRDNLNLEDTPEFEHMGDLRRACTLLGLNLDDLYTGINAQADTAENPPEEINIILGTRITTDTQRGKEYLFRFFADAFTRTLTTRADHEYWLRYLPDEEDDRADRIKKAAMVPPTTTLRVANSVGNFAIELSWDYIDKSTVLADGKVGTYYTEYLADNGRVDFGDWVGAFSLIKISHQITATERTEYLVHGLVYSNQVLGNKWVSVDLQSAFGDPDAADGGQVFTIPIRKDILQKMGSIRSHDLLYEGVNIIVSDSSKVRTSWYATGFGSVFLLIVVVIITVITRSPAGVAIWSAATGILIAQQIILAYIIQTFLILLQDIVGDELALLISVIAILYSPGASAGGLTVTAPSAIQVLNAGLTLYKGIQTLEFTAEMEHLSDKIDELAELSRDLNQEELNRSLNTNLVRNMISNDPYYTMTADTFVYRNNLEVYKPLLITETTSRFVDLVQFTDRPLSPIRVTI